MLKSVRKSVLKGNRILTNQNINTAGDFNYDQHNKKGSKGTHVSGAEARHVAKSN